MKNIILGFLRRGMMSCGIGPMVLVVLYIILQYIADVKTLTVYEVCFGIVSLTVLAFISGGMNVIYTVERLPLTVAVLIHGVVLYVSYLATYLVNGWLERGSTPIFIFTGIFIIAYFIIWMFIYFITIRRTENINNILNKQHNSDS